MKRATTPKHTFTLPILANDIKRFRLTYAQNDKVVLEKSETDMTVGDYDWTITLTQDETNLFKSDYAQAQVRVLTTDDEAFASQIFRVYVGPVLNDEVLT